MSISHTHLVRNALITSSSRLHERDLHSCSWLFVGSAKLSANSCSWQSSSHRDLLLGTFSHQQLCTSCCCCRVCPAANVFGPEEGNEDVYNGSGCRDVVGAVLGGCNGKQAAHSCPCSGSSRSSEGLHACLPVRGQTAAAGRN